ncbi:MAG: hypothetical protein EAY75_15155 [Bacteroidetes bacterium]|nr:MAG: hypothetical protein EAY75_15155 [Bacteroidota bacterium]
MAVAKCAIGKHCDVLLADGTPDAEGLPDTAWVAAAPAGAALHRSSRIKCSIDLPMSIAPKINC